MRVTRQVTQVAAPPASRTRVPFRGTHGGTMVAQHALVVRIACADDGKAPRVLYTAVNRTRGRAYTIISTIFSGFRIQPFARFTGHIISGDTVRPPTDRTRSRTTGLRSGLSRRETRDDVREVRMGVRSRSRRALAPRSWWSGQHRPIRVPGATFPPARTRC